MPHAADGEIYSALLAENIAPPAAARLTVFMPTAFGRLILSRLNIQLASSFIQLYLDGTRSVEQPLASDPMWQEITNFAEHARQQMSKRNVLQIAARSAEFDAVNQLLSRGAQTQDIEFTPLLLSFDLG